MAMSYSFIEALGHIVRSATHGWMRRTLPAGGSKAYSPFSSLLFFLDFFFSDVQDTFDHDKGQKSAISGRRLHWRLSTGFFAFSPGSLCNLVRRAP